MKNLILKQFIATLTVFGSITFAFGQITFTPGLSVSQIVDSLIFNDQGAITNVSFNGSSSLAQQQQPTVQPFTSSGGIFPFSQGLYMATQNAPSVMNDPDLLSLINGFNVTNGSIVEFDFVAANDSMAFSYIFASAEYSGFTCSYFNDVFGFFLSGPGINGTFTNNAINIATIPGTNTPVSINTVNSGIPTGGSPSTCLNANPNWQADTVYFTLSFNSIFQPIGGGFNGATVAMIAAHNLVVGETYHIKLAVANVSDQALNSAVFIEATFFEFDTEPCDPIALEPDVAVAYGWSSMVGPWESGNMILKFCNLACQNETDALVSIEFPANFVPDATGLTNSTFSNNMLTFELNDFQNCETLSIPFYLPGATPSGTQICFPVIISASNDSDLSNNLDTICGIVLNSYDPNMKAVNQPEFIHPDIRDRFVYKVDFQNDGNFPALNVLIRDTMSVNLDLTTFKFLGSSHSGTHELDSTTREVRFIFNDINLESSDVNLEASQGYVIYEIQEKIGLVEGDAIENTAYIFFDFNPPIVTNTTINTNAYPLNLDKIVINEITMYPNPSSGHLKFSGADVQKVVVYDMLGQVVLTKSISNNAMTLNGLNTGVYFVEMHTVNGVQTKKLVVRR